MNFRASSPPGVSAAGSSSYSPRLSSSTYDRWVAVPPGSYDGEVTTASSLETQIAADRSTLQQAYVNNTIFIVGGGIIEGALVEGTLDDPFLAVITIPYSAYYALVTRARYAEVAYLESKIASEESLLRLLENGGGGGYWEAVTVWYIDDAPRG
jgi:hypothetical protein